MSIELLFQAVYNWATGPAGMLVFFAFCVFFIVLVMAMGITFLRDSLRRH